MDPFEMRASQKEIEVRLPCCWQCVHLASASVELSSEAYYWCGAPGVPSG
jgi:hypothetical protein